MEEIFEDLTDEEIEAYINANEWTFAKSMPNNPHCYNLKSKSKDPLTFVRFAVHIKKHGYKMKFKGWDYVCFDVGDFRYWSMDNPVSATRLINRAKNG